jgi:hypothetical protein
VLVDQRRKAKSVAEKNFIDALLKMQNASLPISSVKR